MWHWHYFIFNWWFKKSTHMEVLLIILNTNSFLFESVYEIGLKHTHLQSKALFLFPGGSCASLAIFLVCVIPCKSAMKGCGRFVLWRAGDMQPLKIKHTGSKIICCMHCTYVRSQIDFKSCKIIVSSDLLNYMIWF